jgi:hypothetical protein
MTYAILKPLKVPVVEAIPPPSEEYWKIIPDALRPKKPYTDAEKKKFQADFEHRANNHYYAEWFWFPFSGKVWVNTWESTPDPEGFEEFPSSEQVLFQFIQSVAIESIQRLAGLTGAYDWFSTPMFRTTMICIWYPIKIVER